MKKIFYLFIVSVLSIFLVSCQQQKSNENQTSNKKAEDKTDYIKLLNNAKEIKINESFISFGKHYKIYADGKEVADVKGKLINAFGDTFVMKDKAGHFITEEKQEKRWSLKYTRNAVFTDENNNITGYISETTLSKLFSIGYYFHFYDKNKKEIGVSDQVNFSLLKQNNFYDEQKNLNYHVEQKISILGDKYVIQVKDNKNIPVYQAVMMTCIEDAIKDAEKKKNNNHKNN